MVLSSDKVSKSLKKKGFVENKTHHKYYEFFHDGKLILHTKLSHNGQDINDYLISQMKSQCMLDKKNFLDLINCPLSQEDYIKICCADIIGIVKDSNKSCYCLKQQFLRFNNLLEIV